MSGKLSHILHIYIYIYDECIYEGIISIFEVQIQRKNGDIPYSIE